MGKGSTYNHISLVCDANLSIQILYREHDAAKLKSEPPNLNIDEGIKSKSRF